MIVGALLALQIVWGALVAGLKAAAQCDGVVVVLEAEKSRGPVVEHLVSSLRAVQARVLGAVMNKRRFYVPSRIYRWL